MGRRKYEGKMSLFNFCLKYITIKHKNVIKMRSLQIIIKFKVENPQFIFRRTVLDRLASGKYDRKGMMKAIAEEKMKTIMENNE